MTYGLPDTIAAGVARRLAGMIKNAGRGAGGGGASGFGFTVKKLVIDKVALGHMLNSPGGLVGEYLAKKGDKIVAAARRQVGVDTGALRNSIKMVHFRSSRGQYLWIGSKESHAYMHHEGTIAHVILPTRSTMLRFRVGARIVYSRAVRHPGTRPNKYLSDQLYLVKV